MKSGRSIIIVDDETNIRMTLATILQGAGHQVATAENGASALEHLQRKQFDLVFLDLRMPDMDGMSVFRELRRLHPDTAVIILTGHATVNSAIEAVRLGARDYLLKPIRPDHILERTREILAEQDQAQRQRDFLAHLDGLLTEFHPIGQTGTTPSLSAPSAPPEKEVRSLVRGALELDLLSHQLTIGTRTIHLTEGCFHYLFVLMRHSPDPVSFEELVSEAQGYHLERHEAQQMARDRIYELRKSIEENPASPSHIRSVRGVGYRLVP